MASENSWTVVQFFDDGTVEAVPSLWIQGDVCHWPSYAQPKMMSAIRKCVPLNSSWPTHRIKIFRNSTFGKYVDLILNNFCFSQLTFNKS